jgi:hypothetical protein
MSLQNNKPLFYVLTALLVAVIVLGAFAMSGAAIFENLRFVRAADQILELVSMVRSMASQEKGFAQNPGEDIWSDLIGAGQIEQSASHLNPWQGWVRAVTVTNMAMRIESDLPTHDCSRLALYFLGRQPAELGLLRIEAQSTVDTGWFVIYPLAGVTYSYVADSACGHAPYARLALVFRVR